ncbi:VanZ family protein [Streptomyces sp. bgisy100]|uniref:VanZ family protein n=1 Tax=Streptomyces sp. bgisy100 TaxID=3413783 RepID=UPI003D745195
MPEASTGVSAGLIPALLVTAVLLGVPAVVVAKAKGKPVDLSLLFAVALAGVLTVTLVPESGGAGRAGVCDAGLPLREQLDAESTRLAILLYAPMSCFAVLLFRRPLLTFAGTALLTGCVELTQAWTDLGSACRFDDITANALGGLLGVLLGTGLLCARERRSILSRRDALRGAGAGAVGGLVLAASFVLTVEPVHPGSLAYAAHGNVKDVRAQDAWLRHVVSDLYGERTPIARSAGKELSNGHWRLEAETVRGSVITLWPDRKLEEYAPKISARATGSLSAAEVRAVGDRFAGKWFPGELAGAEVTDRPLRRNGPHVLTYRRYVNGVMMPMRLDMTVSPDGRVMGMAGHIAEDPELPKAVVTEAMARTRAERVAGGTAVPVRLLAQQVLHTWRPVWMVSIMRGPEQKLESSVFLDAVTGDEVTPDPVDDSGPRN